MSGDSDGGTPGSSSQGSWNKPSITGSMHVVEVVECVELADILANTIENAFAWRRYCLLIISSFEMISSVEP